MTILEKIDGSDGHEQPSPITDDMLKKASDLVRQEVELRFVLVHAPVSGELVGIKRPLVRVNTHNETTKQPREIFAAEIAEINPLPQE